MPEQIAFIGRNEELSQIDKLITKEKAVDILFIEAEGGIGKTRLLEEISKRYSNTSQNCVTTLFDFDDHVLHLAENILPRIVDTLGQEIFVPYLQKLRDYQEIEKAGVSYELLDRTKRELEQLFIENFNRIAENQKIVLMFDTTDALLGKIDPLEDFLKIAGKLQNALIIIAGRDAAQNFALLVQEKNLVHTINLAPLSKEDSQQYLQEKQELLHISLEPEVAKKFLLLAGGKAILLDLSIEWRTHGIDLPWFKKHSVEELIVFSETEMTKCRQEFEAQIVEPFIQTRTDLDSVFLLMSWVYPLDVAIVISLLNLSAENAEDLLKEASMKVFVKQLPDGRYKLHDEVERMFNDHVWSQVDPEYYLRKDYSQKVVVYVREKINEETLNEKKEELERTLLKHALLVNLDNAVENFISSFDSAEKFHRYSQCKSLLELVEQQEHAEKFSNSQHYEIKKRQHDYYFSIGKFEYASTLATQILDDNTRTSEQKVRALIDRGGDEIRLGNVGNEHKGAIKDFITAVSLSEKYHLLVLHVKALNALGWAYRQTGDLKGKSVKYYRLARRSWFQASETIQRELKNDFGWISNNLAFALSNEYKTSRTAIEIARETLDYWKTLPNEFGSGACHLVLGIAYYRSEHLNEALQEFQEAETIFRKLHRPDWLGQLYSWRGVTFYAKEQLSQAEKDYQASLKTAPRNFEAMTRNRLGRLYMSLGKWELAKKELDKSLECSGSIPDYVYWLSSIARLAAIASEYGEFSKLEEFENLLNEALAQIPVHDESSLGIAYINIAKLAFGQNTPKNIEKIIMYLQQGITLVIENGPHISTDVVKRLLVIEKTFGENQIDPEIIRTIGKTVQSYVIEKEAENLVYGAVIQLMNKWANWEK